jgi:uncharacterized protein YjbJ (UPF0337 family)
MDEDRLAGTAKNIGGKVEEGLGRATGDVRTEVSGKARQVEGAAHDLFGHAKESAEAAAEAMRDSAATFEEAFRNAIETRPYTAVAAALAIGWIVGRLGRR